MESEEKPHQDSDASVERVNDSVETPTNQDSGVPSDEVVAQIHQTNLPSEGEKLDKTENCSVKSTDSGVCSGHSISDDGAKTKKDLEPLACDDSVKETLSSGEKEPSTASDNGTPDEETQGYSISAHSTIDTNLYFDILHTQWPIVYTSDYNVGFLGLEKLHPFDAAKWGKVNTFLKEAGMTRDETVVKPREAAEKDLLVVHSKKYLDSLKWSINVAQITEVPPVAFLPNFIVQRRVLKPFRFHVGGTVLAGKLAVERGWSINIGGGFHHCSAEKGGGFCAYADITLTIKFLFDLMPDKVKKAMIIDLDAHQGNGHERDFMDDAKVYILDIYNRGIYPHDGYAKRAIRRKVELNHFTGDAVYLELVKKHVRKAFEEFTPDLVVYNAGTDILDGDPLGCLSISPEGIIERDRIVFQETRSRDIPIVMVTSGGYQKKTARIIADSILNLRKEKLIICEDAERLPKKQKSFFKK